MKGDYRPSDDDPVWHETPHYRLVKKDGFYGRWRLNWPNIHLGTTKIVLALWAITGPVAVYILDQGDARETLMYPLMALEVWIAIPLVTWFFVMRHE